MDVCMYPFMRYKCIHARIHVSVCLHVCMQLATALYIVSYSIILLYTY